VSEQFLLQNWFEQMCGIVAFLGDGEPLDVLIRGLERMEYRGYDSAGLALIIENEVGDTELVIEKQSGKVVNLKNKISGDSLRGKSKLGIAHTRWATHGAPTQVNAHPHQSPDGRFAIVHNGIIENHASLKAKLEGLGYKFKSETDTEVLAALIQHVMSLSPDLSLAACVSLALTQVRGAYGIVVVEKTKPNELVGARKGSPLILGVSEYSLVLASDATAIVGLTERVVYLEEEDIVSCKRVCKGGIKVDDDVRYRFSVASMRRDQLLVEQGAAAVETSDYLSSDDDTTLRSKLDSRILRQMTISNRAVSENVIRQMHELTMNLEEIEKQGFDHFMLKEIMEQPKVLKNCMRGRLNPETGQITFGGLLPFMDKFMKARRLIICGCGTSWHSALVGEYVIESLARIPVEVEYASEFRYRNPVLFEDDIVVAISQSGETADTLEAIRIAKAAGCLCVGIVNVVGSSIARATDCGIYLHIGPEIGVASTKAFTGQVLIVSMMALMLASQKGTITPEETREYGLEISQIPDKIAEVLQEDLVQKIKDMSSTYRYAHNFLYLGRGLNFPVALEGALKLKEISYIHAEGYPAAEMKHGPIALVDPHLPCVIIAPKNDMTYEKVLSGIEEVIARKGSVVTITDKGNRDMDKKADFVIEIPSTKEYFYPMLTCIPLQLLAYYIANYRGCEIDTPRNLAKAVTVE